MPHWLLLLKTPINISWVLGFWYAVFLSSPQESRIQQAFFTRLCFVPLYLIDSIYLFTFQMKIPCFFYAFISSAFFFLLSSALTSRQCYTLFKRLYQVMWIVFLTELFWSERNKVSLPVSQSMQSRYCQVKDTVRAGLHKYLIDLLLLLLVWFV